MLIQTSKYMKNFNYPSIIYVFKNQWKLFTLDIFQEGRLIY
jgi:hypothetical protein